MARKFYWLKLKRDFFKRHDIQIIEGMQNGKDYILFYLKLLCESVDHEGNLRFSETIPYSEDMLATITRTNVDIVRSAIKIFTELNMMEILDDGTLYMTEVNKMIDSVVDNENANRQRRFREKQKELALQERYESVTKNNESKSKIKKENNNINIIIKERKFEKPTIVAIRDYCNERKNSIDPEQFYDFYESKNWMIGKNKMKDWKAAIRMWERNKGNIGNVGKKEMPKPSWHQEWEKEYLAKLNNYEKEMTPEEIAQTLEDTKNLFGD